jgi:hypothetical protein
MGHNDSAGNWVSDKIYGSNLTMDTPHYKTRKDYSQVVSLQPGVHTLWHGMIASLRIQNVWKGGGWIEISGVTNRLFPKTFDNRALGSPANDAPGYIRYLGCQAGTKATCTNAGASVCCPAGEIFWSSTSFEVMYGEGGASESAFLPVRFILHLCI